MVVSPQLDSSCQSVGATQTPTASPHLVPISVHVSKTQLTTMYPMVFFIFVFKYIPFLLKKIIILKETSERQGKKPASFAISRK